MWKYAYVTQTSGSQYEIMLLFLPLPSSIFLIFSFCTFSFAFLRIVLFRFLVFTSLLLVPSTFHPFSSIFFFFFHSPLHFLFCLISSCFWSFLLFTSFLFPKINPSLYFYSFYSLFYSSYFLLLLIYSRCLSHFLSYVARSLSSPFFSSLFLLTRSRLLSLPVFISSFPLVMSVCSFPNRTGGVGGVRHGHPRKAIHKPGILTHRSCLISLIPCSTLDLGRAVQATFIVT